MNIESSTEAFQCVLDLNRLVTGIVLTERMVQILFRYCNNVPIRSLQILLSSTSTV